MFVIILIEPGQVDEGHHTLQVLRLAMILRFRFEPVEHRNFWQGQL